MPIQIKGSGYYLPERILDNAYFESILETSDQWIIERTGIHRRRMAAPEENTSDLAYYAACMALEDADISAEELDLIIVATATPDMLFPSTACVLQDRLQAGKAAAFDISAGCTGFIYALTIAEKFLLDESYRHILIVGAETLTRVLDYTDRNTCVLFGDGAGAFVLTRGEKPGIIGSLLGSDGSGGKHLLMPGGGSRIPASHASVDNHDHFLKMNGPEVYKFATKVCARVSLDLLQLAGLSLNDIDWFVPHQANMRIIHGALRTLKIPMEKTLINIHDFGNMSAACIPLALAMAEREGKLHPGNLILTVAFGAGLTYGGVLLYWGKD